MADVVAVDDLSAAECQAVFCFVGLGFGLFLLGEFGFADAAIAAGVCCWDIERAGADYLSALGAGICRWLALADGFFEFHIPVHVLVLHERGCVL